VLASVAKVIGDRRANIVDVTHRRDLPGVALKRTLLEVSIETRDRHHADEIVGALRAEGYDVTTATG
jgi:threonine dehydratase